MKYRWIHLSDIHFAYRDYQSNRLREKLFKIVREISRQDKINFLFITGDITDKDAEYGEEFFNFIGKLLDILGLDKRRFFIVPGNHDVSRKSNRRIELLRSIKEAGDAGLELIENLEEDAIDDLLTAQGQFFDMYKCIKGEEYPTKEIHYMREVDGVKVIHLNTSWLCGTDDGEGKLFLGTDKLHSCLRNASLTNDELNIAIGHHGLECFHEIEQNQLKSLFRDYNIDLYLSGHAHGSLINYDRHLDMHFCVCRQAKSDSYDSGGFAVGNIDTESGNNYIEFHVWNRDKGYWTWDTEVGYQAPYGTYHFNTAKFPSSSYKEKPIVIIYKSMNMPVNQNKLLNDMGFKNVPVYHYPYANIEINSEREWEEHKDNTEGFMKSITKRLENNVLHIFPLSPIPLLIYMGYILQDDSNDVVIYQLDDDGKWVHDSTDADVISLDVSFCRNESQTKKLIVVIEISSKIRDQDIDAHMNTSIHSVLRFTIDNPQRFRALFAQDVKYVKSEFRRETEKYINHYDEIHIFAAMPAGLSVEVGRCLLRSMWPRVYLYDYRRNRDPKYQFAFTIN